MQLKQKEYKHAYAWDALPSEDTSGTLIPTVGLLPKFSNGKESDTDEGVRLALLKSVVLFLFDILGRSAPFWREIEEWIGGEEREGKGLGHVEGQEAAVGMSCMRKE